MTSPDHAPADPAAAFLRAMVRGDHDAAAALVSPDVPADAMSAPRLRDVWAQLVGHLGALASLDPLGEGRESGRRVADFAARFERSEVTLRVVLDDAARVVGFWATPPRTPAYDPPGYADPGRFHEVDLTVGAEPALGATVTLPASGRDWPVAVLVHGSGPNDRDERIGANRPFRDLAWGLAARGIAVLRYDKRTYANPGGFDGGRVTLDAETIDDALAALAAARRIGGVDPRRVVLVGHSLGATYAPEIAARDGALAGIVLLAPGGRPAAESASDQLAYLRELAAAAGQPTAQLDAVRDLLERLAARSLPPEAIVLGVPAAYWYDLDDRRPLDAARALRLPALALFGGRDYQATAADAALWRDALGANAAARVVELPTLDHLFREGEGLATPADYLMRTGHVAPAVVSMLADWILESAPAAATH